MSESKVKRENFITIQGFMLADLKLKGNELLIYACIYGFSQAENQVFNGSLQYLADWTNSTKQGVMKCLKSLEEKGYIVKKENYINGVKFCEYYATKFNTLSNNVNGGMQQSLTPPIKQSLPNNIGFDNIPKNIDYKAIIDCYNDTCVSLQKVKALSDSRKKAIKARLNTYSIKDIKSVFEKAEASDFLKGKNERNWQANFDWLMKDSNFAKVLDGNYDNKGNRQTAPKQETDEERRKREYLEQLKKHGIA